MIILLKLLYYYYFTIIFIIIIVSIIIFHILSILINNCQMIFLLFQIVKNTTFPITFSKIHYSITLSNIFLNLPNKPRVYTICNSSILWIFSVNFISKIQKWLNLNLQIAPPTYYRYSRILSHNKCSRKRRCKGI
jgi:hypothetical protein